jgi:hypothetical protein
VLKIVKKHVALKQQKRNFFTSKKNTKLQQNCWSFFVLKSIGLEKQKALINIYVCLQQYQERNLCVPTEHISRGGLVYGHSSKKNDIHIT